MTHLTVTPGEIHAVLGENGAGKSTLMKTRAVPALQGAAQRPRDGRDGPARRKQRQPVAPDDRRRAACAAGARPRAAATVLAVRGLSLERPNPFGTDLKNIHLQVRAGEVLGIAGVSGNGQQELMAALSGEDTRAAPGSIALSGSDIARAVPRERRRAGLNFVPEERLGRSALPSLSLAQNTLLTRTKAVSRWGWVHTGRVQRLAEELIARFGVRAGGAGAAAKSLSGGNLQKFIVGREISAQPKLLIVSQPTWGVDVGAATQIRGELLALRAAGCALLVVSEELDELFEWSDRLCVIAHGRLLPAVPVAEAEAAAEAAAEAEAEASVAQIGAWMSGLW